MSAISPIGTGSAWATAAAGVAKASRAFDVATETAVAPTSPDGSGDIVSAVVGLDIAKVGLEAALSVARTADETQRTVLDILA